MDTPKNDKEKAKMRKAIKKYASIGFAVLIAVVLLGSYISANNYGAKIESNIKAEKRDSENILAQYGQKLAEAAQVPGMQRDDLVAIFSGSNTSRYGENGSQASFQWLKEHNPNVGSEVYVQVQRIIEAGRNKFENSQTKLIDSVRQYEMSLNFFWRGFWLTRAGFPKIELKDYQHVTTTRAKETFETGVEAAPIKLR